MAELLTVAARAVEEALKLGADEVKVVTSRSRGVDVEHRDGRLDCLKERTQRGLSVELLVAGRYSESATNDLRPEALSAFLAEAVEMTRLLAPDPHRGLPDPARYAGRAQVDLDLRDPTFEATTAEARLKLVAELEERVRAYASDLKVISVTAEVSESCGAAARIHSNGFEGCTEGTSFSLGTSLTIQDSAGRKPLGYDGSSRRHRGELKPLDELARVAVERARCQQNATKLVTGRYPVVVARQSVGRLLRALLAPLSGPALQQRRSLFEGKLNQRIASPLLSLYDDPLKPRALGSALWDDDGFATQRRPLIEAGVLKTFLIDQYYARKLGVEPTGASLHNLDWALGQGDQESLVGAVGEGVLIERFLGGNTNETTGELSLGCAGRVIRGGQVAEAVTEINLSGHFGELWQRLAQVGADPDPESSSGCPTCVFEDVQLSGI